MTPATAPEKPYWTAIYDANCGFCRWSLALLLSADRDRRLRPLALGSAEADRLLNDLPRQEQLASWHLISPGGRRESAGAALPAVLRLLPGGRIPSAALARTPRLTERSYRWVADHRTSLGPIVPRAAKERATRRIDGRAGEAGRA